ncbi:MAG: 4,5-DOPA dioxygenase extradiol [Burkholderiaceae bacterium]
MNHTSAADIRWPVLFIGHGSPLNALEDNPFRRGWVACAQDMLAEAGALPRAILCISAHWLTRGTWLTGMDAPRTIHDFGGFPQALFDVQYPAPGDPDLARQMAVTLRQPSDGRMPGLDEGDWGLDHGAWSVLLPMFPEARIPVIQLSIDVGLSMADHLALGRQLSALRSQGVLIMGSGNTVHNLRAMRRDAADDQAYDWAVAFDAEVAACITRHDHDGLAELPQTSDVARMAHPSWEHYVPLLYAAGAAGESAYADYFNEGFQAASVAMRSVVWR